MDSARGPLAGAKVAWLVPSPIRGSGGHRTIFAHMDHLIEAGAECTALIHLDDMPEEDRQPHRLDGILESFAGPHGVRADIQRGIHIQRPYDLVFATAAWTARIAARTPQVARKAYFVQDYEACFERLGDAYLLAEHSYRLGLAPVTIGRWLTHKLRSEFGAPAQFFDFGVDHAVYRPLGGRRERAVCFVFQPEKPRRCMEIGREALGAIKHFRPDVKIYTYGSEKPTGFWFPHEHLGLISREACNDLYNRCDVGVCLSASNPSRVPFEMMAAGLPVVDLHRDNNLYDIPDGTALLAEAEPYAIAEAVISLLDDADRAEAMRRAGQAFVADRSEETERAEFAGAVERILMDDVPRHLRVQRSYHRPAVTSGRVVSPYGCVSRDDTPPPAPPLSPALARAAAPSPAAEGPKTATKAEEALFFRQLKRVLRERPDATLSLDFWDTLVTRVSHPDEVKLYGAVALAHRHGHLLRGDYQTPWAILGARQAIEGDLGRERVAAGFEDEYALNDVWERLTRTVLLPQTAEKARDIAHELHTAEIAHEHRLVRPIRPVLDLLRAHRGRKLVLSDFYMGAQELRGLLRTAYGDDLGALFYVSAEVGFHKRAARLFREVAERERLAPASVVHIGDNPHSDVASPRACGMEAVHVRLAGNEAQKARWSGEFASRASGTGVPAKSAWHEKRARQSGARIGLKSALGRHADALFDLGVETAAAFAGYAAFIDQLATRHGAKDVFFFTREGVFFEQVYRAYKEINPFGAPHRPSRVIGVSRLATFFPSLRELSTQEMMRMWNLYSTQSMAAMFKSFDLAPEAFQDLFAEFGIAAADPIQYPWLDDRVRRLFADGRFQERLLALRDERRHGLTSYLAESGFFENSCSVVVDIGWRGTIQDNLAYVAPNKRLIGAYLGMKRVLNEQPGNAPKYGFIHDENRSFDVCRDVLKYVRPIEMLTNGPGGSVTGYVREGAAMRTQTVIDTAEEAVFERYTRHFQRGVLAAIPQAVDWLRERALTGDELARHAGASLRRITNTAPLSVVKADQSLNHNETFGVGHFLGKDRGIGLMELARAPFDQAVRLDVVRRLNSMAWPHAFLRSNFGGLGYAWATMRKRLDVL